jgi:hypothetical protein
MCTFFFSFPRVSSADKKVTNEILVLGSSRVIQGNMAAAKSEAISSAMRKAIEEYLILRFGESGMINNFERMVKEIVPASSEEIESFHILAENLSGSDYQILVKVKVNTEVLDEKLRFSGIAVEEAPQSRILFMVSELRGGSLQYWWKGPDFYSVMNQTEVLLYSIFQERGFIPINHTFGIGDRALSQDMKSEDITDADALKWGSMLSADFVVIGKSVLQDDTGATLRLRVLSVKDGLILAEGSEAEQRSAGEETDEGKRELLEKAARKLADKLIPSVLYLGKGTAPGIQHIQVTVQGLRSYRDFKDLQEFLKKDVPGVTTVRQSRMGRGLLTLDVAFAGSEDELLHRLLNQGKLPVRLVLQSATETEINLLVSQ